MEVISNLNGDVTFPMSFEDGDKMVTITYLYLPQEFLIIDEETRRRRTALLDHDLFMRLREIGPGDENEIVEAVTEAFSGSRASKVMILARIDDFEYDDYDMTTFTATESCEIRAYIPHDMFACLLDERGAINRDGAAALGFPV